MSWFHQSKSSKSMFFQKVVFKLRPNARVSAHFCMLQAFSHSVAKSMLTVSIILHPEGASRLNRALFFELSEWIISTPEWLVLQGIQLLTVCMC